MSRRSSAFRRDLIPDPKYDSVEVSKFINNLMLDGKKSLSEKIFYDALEICQERSGQPALTVFTQALTNSKPSLEVKSRRVGGATYQVPMEVRPDRRTALGTRWLISYARQRAVTKEQRSRKRKTHTGWRKPIRRLHTIAGRG
jgi:small subunit ribosomal protein S7